jgi:hypothetical protein
MKWHDTRLAELRLSNDKVCRVSIQQQVRDLQTDHFSYAQACAGQQPENRLKGEWPQRAVWPEASSMIM